MTKGKDWPLKIEEAPAAGLPIYSLGHHPKLAFLKAAKRHPWACESSYLRHDNCPFTVEHIYVRIQAPAFGDDDYSYYISEVPGPARFARKATVIR